MRSVEATSDDAALVCAARAGDKAAFAVLLDRHWPLLVALCRRMTGDADFAQDAAQEAALHAFLSLDQLERAAQFGPWLGGIGLNICRRWLRRRSRDVSWDALYGGRHEAATYALPDERIGPEARAEMADLRLRVQRAVADLPPGQRAATVLFYLYGLSHAEVAAHLGVEVSAVKTRLHKARGTLRRRLWELWEEQDMTAPDGPQWVDMTIDGVRKKPAEDAAEERLDRHSIILKEANGPRYLLIWVGQFEAEALDNALSKAETPRPLTFTFMASLLAAVDVTLREIQITRLAGEVFYATVIVESAAGTRSVDARPSDAMNLAAICGAPIRVATDVLEMAAVVVEKQAIRDEDGRDVIEQTVRHAATGQELERSHLDPVTETPLRTLFRQEGPASPA